MHAHLKSLQPSKERKTWDKEDKCVLHYLKLNKVPVSLWEYIFEVDKQKCNSVL